MSTLLPKRTKILLLVYLFELSFLLSVHTFKPGGDVSWVLLASSPSPKLSMKDTQDEGAFGNQRGKIVQVKGSASAKRYLWGTAPCPEIPRNLAPGASEKLLQGAGKTNRCIVPTEIILHWSESASGNAVTYSTLDKRGLSCQLAVDEKETWQMLEFYPEMVEVSYCAGDWEHNTRSINIELAGDDFDNIPPPPEEYERTLDLVCWLLNQYQIPQENILGHFQIVAEKKDPGEKFLEEFKEKVEERCQD